MNFWGLTELRSWVGAERLGPRNRCSCGCRLPTERGSILVTLAGGHPEAKHRFTDANNVVCHSKDRTSSAASDPT